MIELTPQQRYAVAKGEPVHVVDATIQETLVLIRADVYKRMAGVPAPPLPEEVSSFISPQMLRSQQGFWRDLPELLRTRRNRGKWAAYHGDRRVGIAKTKAELYQHCLASGLPRGDFYVGRIEEEETPPWVPTPMEESLVEVTDEPASPSPEP
jgi:hypothetical protein